MPAFSPENRACELAERHRAHPTVRAGASVASATEMTVAEATSGAHALAGLEGLVLDLDAMWADAERFPDEE